MALRPPPASPVRTCPRRHERPHLSGTEPVWMRPWRPSRRRRSALMSAARRGLEHRALWRNGERIGLLDRRRHSKVVGSSPTRVASLLINEERVRRETHPLPSPATFAHVGKGPVALRCHGLRRESCLFSLPRRLAVALESLLARPEDINRPWPKLLSGPSPLPFPCCSFTTGIKILIY